MPYLCISTLFLGEQFHGRGDAGAPEWPPSPLRLFQSLVAGAASGNSSVPPDADRALRWLERLLPPTVVAPQGVAGQGYRLSVPNNAMDIVARAWARGSDSSSGDSNPATHRTMKMVRPTHLTAGSVHFLWRLDTSTTAESATLARIARRLVVLGWGADFVVGDGRIIEEAEAAMLQGDRWVPVSGLAEPMLRVPVAGTLDDVLGRHDRFLARLQSGVFDPPPPLSAFAPVGYRPEGSHVPNPAAVFNLVDGATARMRAFDMCRRGLTVAGMVRHAARVAGERSGWPAARIGGLILGHAEKRGEPQAPVSSARLAYVPLPSIEPRSKGEAVGAVRRVMVVLTGDGDLDALEWARRALPGTELVGENGRSAALLAEGASDPVVQRYIGRSSTWTTVTPVVLPGYDDPAHLRRRIAQGVTAEVQKRLLARLDERTGSLLRKAIRHAGFSSELAECAQLDWGRIGFMAGADLADRYGVPDHLKRFPRLHVRIEWRDRHGRPVQVAGPCVIGGGRFYGLGLFATERGST